MPRIGESATVSPPWCSPNSGDRVTVGTFANFRIAIDNEFRGEFAYVQYRRWGLLQLWEGGRYKTGAPKRQRADHRIWVHLNYGATGSFTSAREAAALVERLIAAAPVNLDEWRHYLTIGG